MNKLLEHTFADRHDRMNLLGNHDAYRYFRMLELSIEESKAIANALMYAAYVHGCVRIERGRVQWHYLHKSPKYEGCLQLTTWDEYGPVSDERISDAGDFSYLMNGMVKAYVEN
jgi:hypothetical protein